MEVKKETSSINKGSNTTVPTLTTSPGAPCSLELGLSLSLVLERLVIGPN